MSKQQDEKLLQDYVEIDRQLIALDDLWSSLRQQLYQQATVFMEMTWHLFNFDEVSVTLHYPEQFNRLQALLAENLLSLQDVGGLTRIRDNIRPLLDMYKEADYYLFKEIMNEQVAYLKDRDSYESLSNTHIFSSYRAFESLYSTYSDFQAYVSQLNEVEKNRLLLELTYFKQVVEHLFVKIESEFQSHNGKILKDIARIQPVYEYMCLLTA